MQFDLSQTDLLLSTTRAVRKRLDLTRPVPREVISECLELAVQAPTASNSQTWRWVVVDDPEKRAQIAALYGQATKAYLAGTAQSLKGSGTQTERVYDSALWLADNLARVPVLVIPCIEGRIPEAAPMILQASAYGSIFPAVWNFQLALRARGLGSALTTLHLSFEAEVRTILGLPDTIQQCAMLPVAYTIGTDFKPAKRPPVSKITHWNGW